MQRRFPRHFEIFTQDNLQFFERAARTRWLYFSSEESLLLRTSYVPTLNDKSSFVAALLRPKTAGAAGRSQKWQTGWGLDYESVHTPMIGSGTHSLTMEIPLLCPLTLLRRENGLQPLACGDHVGANKSDSWPEGSRFRCRDKPTFRRRSRASASRS